MNWLDAGTDRERDAKETALAAVVALAVGLAFVAVLIYTGHIER